MVTTVVVTVVVSGRWLVVGFRAGRRERGRLLPLIGEKGFWP